MHQLAQNIGEVTSKGGLNHNRLNFTVGFKNQRTYLKNVFCTPPFRLVDISEDKKNPTAYLMTMSSSPGILDHDFHDLKFTLEPNSRTVLLNQSYQRLFEMKHGARQKLDIHLDESSAFSYIQHPIVPHQKSFFRAHNSVFMAANSVLLLGEIITCGRKLSGEIFKFTQFQSLTEIFSNGKMLLKDNILIKPQSIDLNGIGQVEGFTHQATLIYVNLRKPNNQQETHEMNELMLAEEDIQFGISQPQPFITVIRVLGNGGEQMYNAFKKIETIIWKHIPEEKNIEV
jgi:urease accessory protein